MSSCWSTASAATTVRSSTSTRVLPRKAATRSTSISSRRARSSAIERIEVLRDGASAQYGSDAIAAVRNTDVTGALYYPLRSDEHTSDLQSLMRTSYAVFGLKN